MKQIVLKHALNARPIASDLTMIEAPKPPCPEDGIVAKVLYLSLDPYVGSRLRGAHMGEPAPVPMLEMIPGAIVGRVEQSRSAKFREGDIIHSMDGGWAQWIALSSKSARRINPEPDHLSAHVGVLGMPGLTAWAGLLQIGKPKPGDTVFVSGAAGAVGSIVAQVAKLKGCTVVATAGNDEKCEWLKGLGIDHVINYRTCGNLLAAVQAAAPKGIDIYFDNVGGEHLEVAIEVARPFARLIECGMISAYNDSEPAPGPKNLIQIVGKSLTIRGFIVMEFAGLRSDFLAEVGPWIRQGKLKWQETVLEGIAEAPNAFIGLFEGKNTGKMLVKL